MLNVSLIETMDTGSICLAERIAFDIVNDEELAVRLIFEMNELK